MEYNSFGLKEGSLEDFTGFKIIVGSAYADLYQLQVGETMNLEVDGKEYPFTIAGIAEKKGVFLRELADGGTIIMPLDTLTSLGDYSPNLVKFIKRNDVRSKKCYR